MPKNYNYFYDKNKMIVNINFVVNQDPMSWKKSVKKNIAKLLIYPFTLLAALNCNLINFCNKY